MRIVVIGGGPAGLYFSLLMKQQAQHDILVLEQNPPGATYGWGVVFSDVALAFLKDEHREFYEDFMSRLKRCDYMEVLLEGVHVPVRKNYLARIARVELLQLLQSYCRRAGVNLQFESRVNDLSAFSQDDVIVAADGLNSIVRKQFENIFQPSFETRRNKFAWYGTEKLFYPLSLIFRSTPHGVFIGHSYQYNDRLSTFIVETDPETWRRAGIDRMSEEESCQFCAEVFREELDGRALLSNRSTWFQATVVRNQRWFHRNIVLIGDALRTIHFSLGSGTRMAMQDAIALARAFRDCGDDIPAAFREFESVRRPHSEDFQESARRSLDWYENVGQIMHLDPLAFAYDYMLRTGKVTPEELRKRDPEFVAEYERTRAQGKK